MNICVVGCGYVGLVTGACFAEMGNAVVCIDNDRDKIDRLRDGQLPMYEPGLDALVADNAALTRLRFSTALDDGMADAEVIFIAVGTPPNEDGSADLRHVLTVAAAIGERLRADSYCIIATKSTVPVGGAQQVHAAIDAALAKRKARIDYGVVANPEFLKQGAAVEDFMKPDRIIIGAQNDRDLEIMRGLYAPFNRNHERVIAMDIASAEMTKYAANTLLATKISCMNEMANLAERLGADIESVRRGVGADPRIGYSFIYAGCGYGGSCLPKDVRALRHLGAQVGYDAQLLGAVEAVNHAQKNKLIDKVTAHYGDDLSGKTFALWGLAFKPDTDDMREAPSCTVLEALWQRGARVRAFDPVAGPRARELYGAHAALELFADDPYDALRDADGLIVVTEWRMLRAADLNRIAQCMRGKLLIDGRNLYAPQAARAAGLIYDGIGRH